MTAFVTSRRGQSKPAALPAGVLLPVIALGTDGTMVLDDGSFVNVLGCFPRNFDVLTAAERERSSAGLRQLLAGLGRGHSLQIIVENERRNIATHLAFMALEMRITCGFDPMACSAQDAACLSEEQQWHWRLFKIRQESVRSAAPEDLFAPLRRVYIVCRYHPDTQDATEGVRGVLPGWMPWSLRRAEHDHNGGSPQRNGAGVHRTVEEHRRYAHHAQLKLHAVRDHLEREGTASVVLDAPGVLRYLTSRLNPTSVALGRVPSGAALYNPADGSVAAGLAAMDNRASLGEILANFDSGIEHEESVENARTLQSSVAASPLNFREDPFHARIEEDLVRTLHLAGTPSMTSPFWLSTLLDLPLPFTLSVTVHGLDRLAVQDAAQRQEHQAAREVERRLRKGKRDADAVAAHSERAELVDRMATDPNETVVDMSVLLSIRAPGPNPDRYALERAMSSAREKVAIATAGGTLADGHGRQESLWLSTLPFCDDQSHESIRIGVTNAADTVPLIGSEFGSPVGLPAMVSRSTGEIQNLHPFDRLHRNAATVVTGMSGTGKTMFVNSLVADAVSVGARAVLFDRAGHFEFLAKLVGGSRIVRLGGDSGDAINPWDVADPANPPDAKRKFLLELHRVLLNRELSNAEEDVLSKAILNTYRYCARSALTPREGELVALLEDSARVLRETGQADSAEYGRLTNLTAELGQYAGDGVYASVWDRLTTVSGDPPLLIFDYNGASKRLLPSLVFTAMEWTRAYTQRVDREARAQNTEGVVDGRGVVVLDEGHSWARVPEAAEEVQLWAREARRWGAWFIVLSQNSEDFKGDAKAVLDNASLRVFFEQNEGMLQFLRDNVDLPRQVIDRLGKLRTHKGRYAEAIVMNGGRGVGVIRVIFGPHAYWAYTSDPIRDVPRRERALREQDDDPVAALDALAGEGIPEVDAGAMA